MPRSHPISIPAHKSASGEPLNFVLDNIPDEATRDDIERNLIEKGLLLPKKEWLSRVSDIAATKMAKETTLDPFADLVWMGELPDEMKMQLVDEGVSLEGADPGVRALASFGDTPIIWGDMLPAAKAALEQTYREAKIIGEDEEINVTNRRVTMKDGSHKDIILYYDPQMKKLRPFNEPGFDIGDIYGLAGDGTIILGESLGALAGFFGGGAVAGAPGSTGGVILGAPTGAFVGEIVRQAIGHGLGVNDSELKEIVTDAAKVAGISLAGTAGLETAMRLYKFAGNFIKGRRLEGTLKELGLDSEQIDNLIAYINSTVKESGKGFAPRASQQGSDELRRMDENFLTKPSLGFTQEYKAQDLANLDALTEFELIAARNAGVREEGAEAVGQRVQAEVDESVVQPVQREADEIVEGVERKVGETGLPDSTAVPYAEAGVELRGLAQRMQKDVDEFFEGKFDAFLRDDITSTGQPLRYLRGETLRDLEDNLLRMGDEDAKALAKGLGVSLEAGEVSLRQVQKTINTTNRLIREIDRGLTTGNRRLLTNTMRVLKETRDDMLKDNPELLSEIIHMEKMMFQARESVDRTIIGKILTKGADGQFTIKNDKIFENIFKPGNVSDASWFAYAIRGDEDALRAVREGILALYRKKVFTKSAQGTGLDVKFPDKLKHQEFLRDYKDVIEPYLSKEEIKKLDQAGQLAYDIEADLKRYKMLLKSVNDRALTDLQSLSPPTVVKAIMENEDMLAIEVKNIIGKSNPQLLENIQTEFLRQLRKRFTDRKSLDEPMKLSNVVDVVNDQNLMENIEIMIGKQYANDLRTFARGLELIQKRSGLGGGIEDATNLSTVLRNIWRAAFAPPLTRRGRVFTAVESGRADSITNTIGEALVSKEALNNIINARKIQPGTRAWNILLSQAGILHVVNQEPE